MAGFNLVKNQNHLLYQYKNDFDYVRIKLLLGQWQFKPLLNGEVEVTYMAI